MNLLAAPKRSYIHVGTNLFVLNPRIPLGQTGSLPGNQGTCKAQSCMAFPGWNSTTSPAAKYLCSQD